MSENLPTVEEWHRLYAAAVRLKEAAPWAWMGEDDLFGIEHPETGELGFVSIMGAQGEHYALSLYLGPAGLEGFWEMETAGPLAAPDRLLETPQLQASFEDRSSLESRDLETIKGLGLKFRGRQAWPLFRSYRPGYFPWFVTAEEARFLTYALEQTPEVAQRFKADPTLLEPRDEAEEEYLVRVAGATEDAPWEDRRQLVPPPAGLRIAIKLDRPALAHLQSLPVSDRAVEIDFFMSPAPVREGKGRPFFPYLLLMVEARSGLVLSAELLNPDPTLEAMWGSIPLSITHRLAAAGLVPRALRMRSELLAQLLQPLGQELPIEIQLSDTLRSLDQAKEFLLQTFG